MLPPLHALARAEILERALLDVKEVLHDGIGSRKIHRTLRVGEAERLFLAEGVFATGGVIYRVTTGRLVGQPFTYITLVRTRPRCKLGGCKRLPRELAI